MNPENLSRLDDEELLHLAVEASKGQRHADAIHYLKEAASKSAGNAKVHFLLGAEHAQIGLFDRAVEDMTTALKLDPGLVPARFQLGMLFLVRGRVAEALDAWKPLDTLGESDPYLHFKRGLELLVRDEFKRCEECLTRGLQLNTVNPPLNHEMQRILDEVKARIQTGAAASAAKPGEPEQAEHVLLSAYTRTRH
jgi:tetratricopeptide (TPR) repeat protein